MNYILILIKTIFIQIAIFCIYFIFYADYEALGLIYNRIEKYHTNINKRNIITHKGIEIELYDYIIIGSGSSGSVVASRLSENVNNKVLIIESGGSGADIRVQLPGGWAKSFNSYLNWDYTSDPDENINNHTIYVPRGKMLGGSGSINNMIYMRGTGLDYDNWNKIIKTSNITEENATSWDWNNVFKYFLKSENNKGKRFEANKDNKYHSFKNNSLFEIYDMYISEFINSMANAIQKTFNLTTKDNYDVNGEDYQTEGVHYNQFNMKDGSRYSVSDAFLNNDVLKRNNLYIKLHTTVSKILYNNDNDSKAFVDYLKDNNEKIFNNKNKALHSAIGIEIVSTSKIDSLKYELNNINNNKDSEQIKNQIFKKYSKIVFAKKEIIISAGSINTPQLLMLSGIGNATDLKSKNISNIIYDNPEVGNNLQDHISGYICWEPKDKNESYHSLETDPFVAIKSLYNYLFNKSGKLSSTDTNINTLIKSSKIFKEMTNSTLYKNLDTIDTNEYDKIPDIQLTSCPAIPNTSNYPYKSSFYNFKGSMCVVATLLSPKSKGYIKLKSNSFYDYPTIKFNTFSNKDDEIRLIYTIKKLSKIENIIDFKNKINKAKLLHYNLTDITNNLTKQIDVDSADMFFNKLSDYKNIKKHLYDKFFNLYHPSCTASMGKVVNSRLKVIGVNNLRIVDASIMPIITRSNTNAPAIMIAEKASDLIKEDDY